MNLRTIPEQEAQRVLKELLTYDPSTGLFRWMEDRGPVKQGDRAGTVDIVSGYVRIELYGRKYRANRLAWLYMTGKWPQYEVDHKDDMLINNKWNNLQDITKSQNVAKVGLKANNTSGCTGVYKARNNKWEARNQRGQTLGTFSNYEHAVAARLASLK